MPTLNRQGLRKLSADLIGTRADDGARLRLLEAAIETLKAENEILKRRLAAAETRAAQAAITERLDALAAKRRTWRRLAKPAFRILAAAIATILIWPRSVNRAPYGWETSFPPLAGGQCHENVRAFGIGAEPLDQPSQAITSRPAAALAFDADEVEGKRAGEREPMRIWSYATSVARPAFAGDTPRSQGPRSRSASWPRWRVRGRRLRLSGRLGSTRRHTRCRWIPPPGRRR